MPPPLVAVVLLFLCNKMRIASWNVNSIKARLDIVTDWVIGNNCDVLLIQETKSQDVNFPVSAFKNLGWHVVFHGQKSYNGIAIISRFPIQDVTTGLAGDDEDEQARYMEATIRGVRVATIYLPNGNPAPGKKFDYKIAWFKRLEARARELLEAEIPIVLGGDFNVIPSDIDCYDPDGWSGDALTHPESISAFRKLVYVGFCDALREINPTDVIYTYWDYQAGAWQRDHGVRIDHLMLSPEAQDKLVNVGVDKKPRGLEKPSDHTPIWCELAI